MAFAPSPIPSRTQYVLEAIKHDILTGGLRPGQALVEAELAARFGVSKTPVREALKTLAGSGLVVMNQYKGVTVRMVDADMARAVYDVRLLPEPLQSVARLTETAPEGGHHRQGAGERVREGRDGTHPRAFARYISASAVDCGSLLRAAW